MLHPTAHQVQIHPHAVVAKPQTQVGPGAADAKSRVALLDQLERVLIDRNSQRQRERLYHDMRQHQLREIEEMDRMHAQLEQNTQEFRRMLQETNQRRQAMRQRQEKMQMNDKVISDLRAKLQDLELMTQQTRDRHQGSERERGFVEVAASTDAVKLLITQISMAQQQLASAIANETQMRQQYQQINAEIESIDGRHVPCGYCGNNLLAVDHPLMQEDCPALIPVPCPTCGDMIEQRFLPEHERRCGIRPVLGIEVREISDGSDHRASVQVVNVAPNGQAEKAGLMAGDIISRFDGKPINCKADFAKAVLNARINTTVEVVCTRTTTKNETKKPTTSVETLQIFVVGAKTRRRALQPHKTPAVPPADSAHAATAAQLPKTIPNSQPAPAGAVLSDSDLSLPSHQFVGEPGTPQHSGSATPTGSGQLQLYASKYSLDLTPMRSNSQQLLTGIGGGALLPTTAPTITYLDNSQMGSWLSPTGAFSTGFAASPMAFGAGATYTYSASPVSFTTAPNTTYTYSDSYSPFTSFGQTYIL